MEVKKYEDMIEGFLENRISVEEFEETYLREFKTDPEPFEGELYDILESLFSAVDSYWYECEPGQETTFMISEDRLRQEAKEALNQLRRLSRQL